jgi:hypothetical protein
MSRTDVKEVHAEDKKVEEACLPPDCPELETQCISVVSTV